MLRIIRFIFTGDWHLHEWINHGKQAEHYTLYPNGERHTNSITQARVCIHCGDIKIDQIV